LAKSAALAAVLSFFVWGLGYLYLGKKKSAFVAILVVAEAICLYAPFSILETLGLAVVSAALAYDTYEVAKGPP